MEFALYDAPEQGELLWYESRTLSLRDGMYGLQLGETTPLDSALFDGEVLYLSNSR